MSAFTPEQEARIREIWGELQGGEVSKPYRQAHLVDSWTLWGDFTPLESRPFGARPVDIGLAMMGVEIDLIIAAPPSERFPQVRLLERSTFKASRLDEILLTCRRRYDVARMVAPFPMGFVYARHFEILTDPAVRALAASMSLPPFQCDWGWSDVLPMSAGLGISRAPIQSAVARAVWAAGGDGRATTAPTPFAPAPRGGAHG